MKEDPEPPLEPSFCMSTPACSAPTGARHCKGYAQGLGLSDRPPFFLPPRLAAAPLRSTIAEEEETRVRGMMMTVTCMATMELNMKMARGQIPLAFEGTEKGRLSTPSENYLQFGKHDAILSSKS